MSKRAEFKVHSFRYLTRKDDGIAAPVDEVVDAALQTIHVAESAGFTSTNAFPGEDGSIQIVFRHDATCLQLTITPDPLEVDFLRKIDHNDQGEEQVLDLNVALNLIRKYSPCPFSDFSKRTTGTLRQKNSGTLLSYIPVKITASPLYAIPAQEGSGRQLVLA